MITVIACEARPQTLETMMGPVGRFAFTLPLLGLLSSCGGSASPTAPTQVTQVTPIVVSVTAQVVDNAQSLTTQALTSGPVTENRNVRVTGAVSVIGGVAAVETRVIFTPEGGEAIELIALTERVITPVPSSGTPFDLNIPFSILPLGNAEGLVRVEVVGADERGGVVNVSTEVSVTADNTLKSAGTCVEDDRTLCVPDDRFEWTVEWMDADGTSGPGIVTSRELGADIFTFTGADGGGVNAGGDLFVSHVFACNAPEETFAVFLSWIVEVGFTLTGTDTETNQTREFVQPPGEPGADLIFETFATCP